MSNLSQFFGGGGIKSIQTFESEQTQGVSYPYTTIFWGNASDNYVDITISQVDVNKTVLIYNVGDGGRSEVVSNGWVWVGYTGHFATILNSTTIRVSGPQISYITFPTNPVIVIKASINVQVIEFN